MPFDHGLPTEIDMQSADQLRKILASAMPEDGQNTVFQVNLPGIEGSSEISLSQDVTATLLHLLRLIGSRRGYKIVPYGAKLTTQEAADLLNVSRPYLIKLIEKGELGCEMVGRHRRIDAEKLFAFQERRDDRRTSALTEMAERDAKLGLI